MTNFQAMAAMIAVAAVTSIAQATTIVTPEDALYCNIPATNPFAPVDPATLPDDGSVYQVGTNRWTLEKEQEYSDWVKTEVDRNFQIENNIEADCTDVTTIVRLVFARMNNLPMMINTGDNYLTHKNKSWRNLRTVPVWSKRDWKQSFKNDLRFRAFMKTVAENVNAVNLTGNTYPVAISATVNGTVKLGPQIRGGTVLLELTHSRFVHFIDQSLWHPVQELWGSWGVSKNQLNSGNQPWQYGDGYPVEEGRGVVNWRWAVECGDQGWKLLQMNQMPGYSVEQYQYPEWNRPMNELRNILNRAEKNLAEKKAIKKNNPQYPYIDRYIWLWELELLGAQKSITWKQNNPTKVIPRNFTDMYQAYARENKTSAPSKDYFQNLVNELSSRLVYRVKLVLEAQEILKGDKDAFTKPGSDNLYEDYSTPGRDKADLARFRDLYFLAENYKNSVGTDINELTDYFASLRLGIGGQDSALIQNAASYYTALEDHTVDYQPQASIEARWGLKDPAGEVRR